MKKHLIIAIFSLTIFLCPLISRAMPPGTLLYRTAGSGKMYGLGNDPLINIEKGIVRNIYSGHVAIYIGRENGIDYIVEALAGGIVKTPADQFLNLSAGEELLGAKIPIGLTPLEQAKAVAIAKNLAELNLGYDLDFKRQKGSGDGDWTCVGLAEKIYESAAISNPYNLGALEYDPNYYAVNITPDGYDNYSLHNTEGDCLSAEKEFSKIARRRNMILPAPEIIGFDAGLEYGGERYIFLPYTQLVQPTLKDASIDISLASNFDETSVRGAFSQVGLVLRWSLVNNPVSSVKKLAGAVKEVLGKIGAQGGSGEALVLEDTEKISQKTSSQTKSASEAKADIQASIKSAYAPPPVSQSRGQATSSQEAKTSAPEAEKELASASQGKNSKPVEAVNLYSPPQVHQAGPLSSGDVTAKTTSSSPQVNEKENSAAAEEKIEVKIKIENDNPSSSSQEEDNEEADLETPKLALLDQVYSTGDNDVVRLYNPSDNAFDLAEAEYRLEKSKTALDPSLIMRIGNAADGTYPGGTTIEPRGYYFIVRDDADSYYLDRADAVATRDDFVWTGSGYTLFLGTGAISSSSDADIVDVLGFGSNATYFQGSGPAPEIAEHYFLSRLDDSGDNASDWELVQASDEAATSFFAAAAASSTVSTSTEEVQATSTEPLLDNWSAFVQAEPLSSEGLSHIWHFDECYGSGVYKVGRWDCALELNYLSQPLSASIDPAVNLNNFSASFYIKSPHELQRTAFILNNDENKQIRFALETNQTSVFGLPDSEGFYFPPVSLNDDQWHQAALVVDQPAGYWAAYLDGQEIIKEGFIQTLPSGLDTLTVQGELKEVLVDELAIWSRPLSASEIAANYTANRPFAPQNLRSPQSPPALLYYWDFNEGEELVDEDSAVNVIAVDEIAGLQMSVWPETWIWRKSHDSALLVSYPNDINLEFPSLLNSKDLSMAFWWRNSEYPGDSRLRVSLKHGSDGLALSLVPSYFRSGYWFNNNYGLFAEGVEVGIPYDEAWHHLAVVYDSYRYHLYYYVDGELEASAPYVWIREGEEADNLEMKSEYNKSEIDELKIWQGALLAGQVREIYELSR